MLRRGRLLRGLRLVLAFVLVLLAWPRVAASAPQPERAWEHARALVRDIGPRPAGSPAAGAAARYVADYFMRLGVATQSVPTGTQTVPEIRLGDARISEAREVTLDDETIVATIPATDGDGGPAILIMAHVDTVDDAPGAIDNAAAVGVLLELGRALLDEPSRPHDVILAATAGEEVGLLGARALAATYDPGRVGVAISMDLVGRSGPVTLNGLSANLGEAWLDRIATAATNARIAIEAPLTHQIVSRLAPQLERSDHGAFTERGIPAFHLYHRGPGRIYLQYHGPADTLDQIDSTSLTNVLALLHAFVLDEAALPPAAGTPATWMPFGETLVVRDSVLWAIELLMLGFCVVGVHRCTVRGVGWRVRASSSAAAFGIVLVAWSIAIAIEALALRVTDHPQPWLHAPGRWTVATLLVVAGLLAASSPSLRARTHLGASAGAPAIVIAALPGALLLWFDVVALAWIPLAQAVALSVMGWARHLRTRALLLAVALFPAWACVDPDLLREAAFHHFLPAGALLALLLVLPFVAATLAAARLLATVPMTVRWRIAVAAIAVCAWIAVALASAQSDAQCDAATFASDGLACEL